MWKKSGRVKCEGEREREMGRKWEGSKINEVHGRQETYRTQ